MIKRILIYVVVSSIISAGLLYLGITIMGKYSPDLASSLSALVAGTHGQNSSVALAADSDQSLKAKASVNSITTGLPVAGVTIAQLLNNPDHFIDQVITITGIATSLSDDKFLLNDGTGQILVEVEDDLVSTAALNSLSITVSGRLDGLGSQTGLELDASTLIDPNGAVIIDDDDDDIDDDTY